MAAYVVVSTDSALADRALADRVVGVGVGVVGVGVGEVWRGLRIVGGREPRTHDIPARVPPSGSRRGD
ncbi:hypothetical protein ACFY3V_19020 [Streptosporangium sp. NPDC000095]|uniref:hypothetical protein n=1 Tax=Streptosporangium sp. NPDC000095 TaxID=3366184 RepID=UPI003679EE7C